MPTRSLSLLTAILLALAAGCTEPAADQVVLPARVLAALPQGVGPEDVVRRDDGCYFIVIEDELSGVIRPINDERGFVMCDEPAT